MDCLKQVRTIDAFQDEHEWHFQNDLVSKYVFKNRVNLIKFDQVMRHDNPKRIYLI